MWPCSFSVHLVGGYLPWRSPVLPAAVSLTWEEGKEKKGDPHPPPEDEAQPHPHPGPGGVARPSPTPRGSAKPAVLGGVLWSWRVSGGVGGRGWRAVAPKRPLGRASPASWGHSERWPRLMP